MGASTVGNIIAETIVVIWQELQPQHMPVPTKETFEKIAEDFYNIWNFPHVIGAIDGKHIRVICPKNSGSMFFNYKKYFSIVLQGIADANYRLIAIDVGGYGKQSDGGTFQSSDFYKMLTTKEIKIPESSTLPETNTKAPFVFIGDEAYPLLDFLLKPFGGKQLPIEHECFNSRLSRARKTIECTFGILTAKWRILSKPIETDILVADNVIKCICILHNVILNRENFQRHLTNVEIMHQTNRENQVTAGRPTNAAKTIRDIFVNFFSNNPLNYRN